jgi:hypothetical protein
MLPFLNPQRTRIEQRERYFWRPEVSYVAGAPPKMCDIKGGSERPDFRRLITPDS